MKRQIVRFSPHQNAKVVAILMALGSLVFLIPMFVVFSFTVPPVGKLAVHVEWKPVEGWSIVTVAVKKTTSV